LTIVVLLFLAGIWAAVLIPPILRARTEGRPADSIGSFRRQLHVLERTGPVTVPPANRLLSSQGSASPAGPVLNLTGASPVVTYPRPSRTSMARKRRRDVFYALSSAMGATLVLGLLPGMRALLAVHLVLDVLFVAYVALLVRMRNLAAEREMKLRFLPGANAYGASASYGMGYPEPALALRRSAN
jgi:hypothetical protein